MVNHKKTPVEFVESLMPMLLGLACIAAGLYLVWQGWASPSHRFNVEVVASLVATGIACVGYWAFVHWSGRRRHP